MPVSLYNETPNILETEANAEFVDLAAIINDADALQIVAALDEAQEAAERILRLLDHNLSLLQASRLESQALRLGYSKTPI